MIDFIKKLLKRRNFVRFIKFGFVGGTVFTIHTFMLWLFRRGLYLDTVISATIAYIIGAISSFCLNNFITFKDSETIYKKRIVGYVIVAACNYFINTFIVYMVLTFIIDNILCATIAATSITVFFTFFVFNNIVYRTYKPEADK